MRFLNASRNEDELLVVGDESVIDKAIEEVKKSFSKVDVRKTIVMVKLM